MQTLRVGRPAATSRSTSAPSSIRCSSTASTEIVGQGQGEEGGTLLAGLLRAARAGNWFAPSDPVHRRRAVVHRIAEVEIFGPVAGRDDLPHAGRGGADRQSHALWPCRQPVVGEQETWRSTAAARMKAGVVWDQLHRSLRCGCGLRRLTASRASRREGGREGTSEMLRAPGSEAIESRWRPPARSSSAAPAAASAVTGIDLHGRSSTRSGGKQARP
jgi:hypothetical protein